MGKVGRRGGRKGAPEEEAANSDPAAPVIKELSPWLQAAISESDALVTSFVDLGTDDFCDPSNRAEAYKTWMTKVTDTHPLPEGSTSNVGETDAETLSKVVRATAINLVQSSPLIAATYMTMEGSDITNVDDWAEAEKQKDAERAAVMEKTAGSKRKASEAEETHDVAVEGEPERKKQKRHQPVRDRDFICCLPVDTPAVVRADPNDAADPTGRKFYNGDVIPVFPDDIKTVETDDGEEDKWGKIADGYVKLHSAKGEDPFKVLIRSEHALLLPTVTADKTVPAELRERVWFFLRHKK